MIQKPGSENDWCIIFFFMYNKGVSGFWKITVKPLFSDIHYGERIIEIHLLDEHVGARFAPRFPSRLCLLN